MVFRPHRVSHRLTKTALRVLSLAKRTTSALRLHSITTINQPAHACRLKATDAWYGESAWLTSRLFLPRP